MIKEAENACHQGADTAKTARAGSLALGLSPFYRGLIQCGEIERVGKRHDVPPKLCQPWRRFSVSEFCHSLSCDMR
jgi:hypothetical protein